MRIDGYIDEYLSIKDKILNRFKQGKLIENPGRLACLVLKERAKDRRMREINNVSPATEKQKKFMDDLGIEYEDNITKSRASRLISKTLSETD